MRITEGEVVIHKDTLYPALITRIIYPEESGIKVEVLCPWGYLRIPLDIFHDRWTTDVNI